MAPHDSPRLIADIGGAFVPRLEALFDRSAFRRRFEDTGRFSRYLAAIATVVITADNATAIGVAAILDAQRKAMQATPGAAILGQIRRACRTLLPAE